MKQKFNKNINYLQIFIFLAQIFYIILPESKKNLLNDIIIFENTNGDIYLAKDYNENILVFGTTLSNEEDRIFYALKIEEDYIFKDNEDSIPFIIKNINRTDNKKIQNAKMGIIDYSSDDIFIILIGTNDSYIEAFNIFYYSKNLNLIPNSDFLPQNTINKGISPLIYINNRNLIFISSSKYNDDTSNFFISANKYLISSPSEDSSKFNYELQYNNTFDNIKGEYFDCFEFSFEFYSCFFLDINNNYRINIIEHTDSDFIEKNYTIIGNISNPIDGEFYFLKGLPIVSTPMFYAIYIYYSGNLNNIPSFLFINIDTENYIFSNKYNEQYQSVSLYDYPFNNGIKYNDAVLLRYENDFEDLFFVSTNIDKEYLIIAYLTIFTSSSSSETKLSIRYYIIQLKDYFDMNIFHGIKMSNFGQDSYLSLAFDFCLSDQCESSNNGNAALMILSYPNKTHDLKINFTEYAFNNNRIYIDSNLSEYFSISNNIFGNHIDEVVMEGIEDYFEEENGINFYYGINLEPFYDDYIEIDEALLRVDFSKYNFDDPFYGYEILFLFYAFIYPEEDVNIFNSYLDNYNDTFGDINDENSFYSELCKYSTSAKYSINMEDELSRKCNDSNCILCLRNVPNYCIVCIDDNYTFISDEIYGKRKICIIEENEDIPTEPISTEKLTEKESTNIDKTIIFSNKINELSYSSKNYMENIDTTFIGSTIITSTLINNQLSYSSNSYIENYVSTNVDMTNIVSTIINNEISYSSYYNMANIDTTNIGNTIIANTLIDNQLSYFSNNYKENSDIININELSYISNHYIEDAGATNEITQSKNGINLEDLLNGKYKDINLSNEEIKYTYGELQSYLKETFNGENTIINTNNVKIQISKVDEQKNYQDLSNIDLGECEEKLKLKYCKSEEDSLIILKFDIVPENEKSTFVVYEIYDPYTLSKIDLNECEESNVVMNIPIELDSEIEEIYDLLSKSGYNLFNDKNEFYNDICATYTTKNGTDILLYDRRMDIYQLTVNISLCQEGCEFSSYDLNTKKAKCICQKKTNINEINSLDISNLQFDKNEMLDRFKEVIDNSNFRVLKCYQLLLKFNLFIKNIGSIIMTILFILFLILLVIYKLLSSKKIHFFIKDIINYKNDNIQKHKIKNIIDKKLIKQKGHKKGKYKNKNEKKNKSNKSLKSEKKSNYNNNKNKSINNINSKKEPPKKSNKHSFQKNLDTLANSKNVINKTNLGNNSNESDSNLKKKKRKAPSIINNDKKEYRINIYKKYNNIKIKYANLDNNKNYENIKKRGKKLRKPKKTKKLDIYISDKGINNQDNGQKLVINKLNDQEINSLEYEQAIELDKRTYFQYYLSLIKKKQLILFTFLPSNDYNLPSLKISLFLVSFSLYLTINAFFFNDDTMHKIYKDSGAYNILYQIPQILYSSITSSVINMILKTLSLSEKDILKIKQEKDVDNYFKKANQIEKCIKIKFIMFFIISILLMLFFWYYISCFCAVYTNTQTILFKDTLISFALSMLYPFGLNLLPGLFRIPSLRSEKKDKKCLYSFSQIIALI